MYSRGQYYEKENNYIASLYFLDYCYILTYSDITTGIIFGEIIENDIHLLINKIIYLGIKELILNNKVNKEITSSLKDIYKLPITIIDFDRSNIYTNFIIC